MKLHSHFSKILLVLLLITSLVGVQYPMSKVWSITGSPFNNLPPNMERLTTFGWRPNLSPDGRVVVFVNKEFGDVFTMDLVTRQLDCLTDNICPEFPQHDAFIRASHLPNGDYLLADQ